MCALNQLKKKLHLKKLVDFLNKHRFVLFYQCKQEKSCVPHTLLSHHNNHVLFLVNSARVRKLTHVGKAHKKVRLVDQLSHANILPATPKHVRSNNFTRVKERLSLLSKGSAMGSTLLVACDNLENMQNCITKCSAESTLHFVCLGGIYDNVYVDNLDCFRLAKMQSHQVYGQLLLTLSGEGHKLVRQLSTPGLVLNHCLAMSLPEQGLK